MSTASIPLINKDRTLPPLLLPNPAPAFAPWHDQALRSAIVSEVTPRYHTENSIRCALRDLRAYANLPRPQAAPAQPQAQPQAQLQPQPAVQVPAVAPRQPSLPASAVPILSSRSLSNPVCSREISSPPDSPYSRSVSASPSRSSSTPAGVEPMGPLKRSVSESGRYSEKRQRNGPSCDNCRSKKIKCNAKIEVLLQNDMVLNLFSNKLHHVIQYDEYLQFAKDYRFINMAISPEVLKQIYDSKDCDTQLNKMQLVKHLDKLIIFRPCTSCNKKKYSINCTFGKGLTRADINIFLKIKKRVANIPIYDMTIENYEKAGFFNNRKFN